MGQTFLSLKLSDIDGNSPFWDMHGRNNHQNRGQCNVSFSHSKNTCVLATLMTASTNKTATARCLYYKGVGSKLEVGVAKFGR